MFGQDENEDTTLFELVDVHGRLTLDQVYGNGLHALKRLTICNLTDRRIVVRMRSNLRNQITFQTENENLVGWDVGDNTTNTVAWSQQQLNQQQQEDTSVCNNHRQPWNELFNIVNHIDELILNPRETRPLILGFLPDAREDDDDTSTSGGIFTQDNSETDTFNWFNVTGSLFFFGYVDAVSNMADYQQSIKFRASVCQSTLWTDVTETGINFDDCVMGKTYHRDFTVKNKSDIDLYWKLNTVDMLNGWLDFADADTGATFMDQQYGPIGGCSSRRIRITFTPKDVGEFNYDLQLENLNDARNVVQCKIHAIVRSVAHKESLVVASGNLIDFGDCISGQWTVQQMVLNNISETPVEVRFLPEGGDVVFDIKSSLDTPNELAPGSEQRSNLVTPPTTTLASNSDFSATDSDFSRSSSPISMESSSVWGGVRIHTPSQAATSVRSTGDLDVKPQATSLPVENYSRIEDLLLKPGKERTVQVSYRPQKDANLMDFNAGQLIRRNFRIVLEYGTYRSTEPKERKSVQCRARTCTSFVEVIPKEINFGDTDVGTLKSIPINIFNRSDILARVELEFTSKVLNCLRGEITIQPRSYVELKLDLYPRKVNPEYRKQITLVNYLNNDNDQIIEVQSTNIDKNRVTFHSLFYRILTATGANYLDFGSIALNSPSLRTFTVENIRNKPLTLDITTSIPQDLVIYVKKKRTNKSTTSPQIGKGNTPSVPSAPNSIAINNHDSSIKKKDRRMHLHRVLLDRDNSSINNGPINNSNGTDGNRGDLSLEHQQQQKRIHRADRATYSSTAYLDLATAPAQHKNTSKRRLLRSINKKELNDLRDLAGVKSQQVKTEKKRSNGPGKNLLVNNHGAATNSNNNGIINGHTRDNQHKRKSHHRHMGITAARYKSRKNLDWSDIAGQARVPFEDLLSVLEHGSKAPPPLFPKQAAEEQFVRHQLAWRRELERLIEKGDLVQTSLVHVDPEGEEEVVIVFTPNGETKPHVKSAPKKQDGRIFLRLVDFDRDIEQTEFENLLDLDQCNIPLREVIVRAQLCRSVMDLGQKNINFGMVERNERHAKSIVLHNRSETPLLYAIRKSGSIASGDIDLGAGRYGVVRSFGKREIEFTFEPTLPGSFMEKLTVENIRDRHNDQVLSLKAIVRKPSTFFIQSLELAFGPCLVDHMCTRTEAIVVTNTNKQSRMFEVRVDPNEAIFGCYFGEFDFVVDDDESKKTLSKEAEEEIENLEQKLKIARRKNQPDKINKYIKKLAKLKDNGAAIPSSPTVDATSTSTDTTNGDGGNKDMTAMIFKKTSESVVFPLDPHATKTITVYLKAALRPLKQGESYQDIDMLPLHVRGRIMVHEYKNTDVCKSIMYTALICKNQADYNRELALEGQQAATISPVVSPTSSPSSPPSSMVPPIPEVAVAAEPEESLVLERTSFDGGKAEIDQQSTFYVRVTNQSDKELPYSFVVDDNNEKNFFICPTTTTPLVPSETRKILFDILPTTVGKQHHTLSIRNDITGTMQTFTLQVLVHRKQYLSFPSLSEDTNGELDLGFSYVDPGNKYSQVTPLLVKNITDEDVYITCQSNLSHQVLIFMDETGKRGLVDMMPFKRGNLLTVWVAVQPNLLTGYLGNSEDECRELVGGIKFSIYTKDDGGRDTGDVLTEEEKKLDAATNLMWTQTVKFTSIIGQSHLQVSHQVINLGYTDLLHEEFYGAFTIQNKSGQLPLDYEVECTSGNIVLDRRGGTLNGWKDGTGALKLRDSVGDDSHGDDDDENYGDALTTSLAQITFRIYSYRHGLLTERLLVTNMHNSKEVFEIEVRLFVDCGKMDLLSIPSRQTPLDDTYHSNHREAYPLRTLKWESIYICPVDEIDNDDAGTSRDNNNNNNSNNNNNNNNNNNSNEECHDKDDGKDEATPKLKMIQLPPQDEQRLYIREIEVANTSGQPMMLTAGSDIDVKAQWVVQDQAKKQIMESTTVVLASPFTQCSDQVALQPGQRLRIQLYCPSVHKLSAESRNLALQGRSGSLEGMLVLYDSRQQVEVLAMELQALFCVSLAALSVERIDLGKIGHINSWKPTKFQFSVRNLSDVPVSYTLQASPFLNFVPLDKNGVALINWDKNFYVPAKKSQTVEGTLETLAMVDQISGHRRIDIQIINQRNPSNYMMLRLKALMTSFELFFDGLTNGELVLPTLQHPIPDPNVTCDNWFVIRNTTDDDIRFEIGADISSDLVDYIRLDVLSRYSNSPLKGGITVSAQGKMEVRIRAAPNEATRLPLNRPDLMDATVGVILANLWVTTRPKDEDQTVREVIPVRSYLMDTPTFSLSERRLDFKLMTYYREDQEQQQQQQRDDGNRNEHHRQLERLNRTLKIDDDQLSTYSTPAICVPESYSLIITNHANKVPLRFKVTIEGPTEFPAEELIDITPLGPDGTGQVLPGDSLSLTVALANPEDNLPEQIKIHVDDLDAIGDTRQTTTVFMTEIVWDL
ncbi:hypothetical protein BC941DRAFT_429143 [Chlamydoabsidia padenii]|nr:hypothetical protein BC941DRAFT_429143 [Chlamydoabsidia padenii]